MWQRFRLELLLILAVVLLIGQIAWPAIASWWKFPSPGGIGTAVFQSEGFLAPEYAIYLPEGYNEELTDWPLVVFLHGSGERGNDPAKLLNCGPFQMVQQGGRPPAIVVAPQCLGGTQWEAESIVSFIRHVQSEFNVDGQRIYLVGYSMGGYGTWATAAEYPDLFAAIVPICGGGDPDEAKVLVGVPVWAFHGAKDDAVPLAQSERIIEAIRTAGGQPTLTVFPNAGHGICQSVCGRIDLWEWLFKQTRELQANSQSTESTR